MTQLGIKVTIHGPNLVVQISFLNLNPCPGILSSVLYFRIKPQDFMFCFILSSWKLEPCLQVIYWHLRSDCPVPDLTKRSIFTAFPNCTCILISFATVTNDLKNFSCLKENEFYLSTHDIGWVTMWLCNTPLNSKMKYKSSFNKRKN
jgi:hypothetical protein